jgi:exodeoxyribonuclease VII large subunit
MRILTKNPLPPGIEPFRVSELTENMRLLLEDQYANIWVEGEISNVSRPQSGHIYLTLKDSTAQLKSVIYRSVALRMRFDVRDGMQVFARGRMSIFAPQGQYQLNIEECHPKGVGAAELGLRQLKEKLLGKGYFDPERKKRLPAFPKSIALVTSPTGASVRDILELLSRRWPCARVTIFPVRVQGETASAEIAAAIRILNRMHIERALVLDSLIVGRGGGSLEDLWAFNEEIVADAIFASYLPVISAVGHEIDVTIADLVADYRALTPSQAVTALTPDRDEMVVELKDLWRQLDDAVLRRIELARRRVDSLADTRSFKLPLEKVLQHQRRLEELGDRLKKTAKLRIERCQDRLAGIAGKLQSLSPLNVLARGYSLTRTEKTGELVRDSSTLSAGDRVRTILAEGEFVSRVEEVHAEK